MPPTSSNIHKKLIYLLNFELLATLVLRAVVKIHKRNHKRHKQNHKHYKQPHIHRHIFLPCTEVLIQSEENLDSTVFFDPSKDKKKIVYPDETINESLLQAAMTVEDHLSSLSISSAENFSLSNNPKSPLDEKEKHSFFEDTFVDETSVIEVLSSDSNKIKNIIQNESQVGLDSDDEELVELLQELKQYNDAKASTSHQESENESTQSSLNLSEFSQRQRDNYEKEVTETLEMSQLIWDEDPFDEETTETPLVEDSNVDFDNDSFWDNYDFDSVLN